MKMMMVVAVAMVVITAVMGGEVYNVGDHFGWTNIGHVDYKTWASSKVFRVGDTIVFQYNKIFHDVARVSYTDFKTCNITTPYATFTSGNDSFPIKYPGHYFFICTQPHHCNSGQKVDIRVPFPGSHTAPPPTTVAHSPAPVQPLPFPYPQPYAPSPSPSLSPSPSPSLSPSPSPSLSPSPSPTLSPSPSPTLSPSPSPSFTPSPSPSLSPVTPPPMAVQAPAMSQSPAPSMSEESPAPTPPAAPAPEVAPSRQKSRACELGIESMIWVTIMVVSFYLIGLSF